MFDFGIGSSELIVIAIVALIVIGPKDLPKVLRTVGQVMTKVRSMAREFQGHLEDAVRETGLDDLKNDIRKAASVDIKGSVTGTAREPGKVTKTDPKDAPNAETPKSSAADKVEDKKAS